MVAVKTDTPRQGLVERVHDQIFELINRDALEVGAFVPSEIELARRFNVSRTVIREAIGRLVALGVLDTSAGRAPKVAAMTAVPITTLVGHAVGTGQIPFSQVWETRRCIEIQTARLAATHRTPEEAGRLLTIADTMRASGDDIARISQLDIEFHALIATISRNLLMNHLLEALVPLIRNAIPTAWRMQDKAGGRDEVFDAHSAIADAIQQRAPDLAVAAMDRHFDENILRRLLQHQSAILAAR